MFKWNCLEPLRLSYSAAHLLAAVFYLFCAMPAGGTQSVCAILRISGKLYGVNIWMHEDVYRLGESVVVQRQEAGFLCDCICSMQNQDESQG